MKKSDYSKFSWQKWLRFAGESLLLCLGVNYLFYKNLLAFLFLWPLCLW